MSDSRTVFHAVSSTDRLVAVTALVALLEWLLRVAVAIAVDPIAAVLVPPIVAVVGLAWAVPAVRTSLNHGATPTATEPITGRLPPLAVVAVGGHALAVALGTALFLLVDTPIRFLLYATGRGELITFELVAITPLAGVATGTLLAWVVPAIAVVRVAEGTGAIRGFRDAITTAVRSPRALEAPLVSHLAVAGCIGALAFGVLFLTDPRQVSELAFGANPYLVVLAVGGLVVVFATAVLLAVSLVLVVDHVVPRVSSVDADPSAGPNPSAGPDLTTVPMKRLAVTVLLLTALVATVGAVRMAELRPMETSPEPLPDDPDELYATALENTDRSSYEYRYFDYTDDVTDEPDHIVQHDREDRQLILDYGDGPPRYGSMGTMAPVSSAAPDVTLRTWVPIHERSVTVGSMPGYPSLEDGSLKHHEPSRTAEGWAIQDRSDDELVLELTDPDDVHAALTGRELTASDDGLEVHESWARVTVDTERKTVSDAEFRLDATLTDGDDSERAYEFHSGYEYETDIDVERPEEYGSPTADEWLWKLFAY